MNAKKFMLLSNLLILFICSSCASFTSPARMHELSDAKSYWFDYDATRRGAIVIPQNQKMLMCSEPSPDVALEMVDKFLLKIGYEKISAEAQAEISTKVIELGKRTQTIMFLRESLYRLCEMSSNFKLSPDEVKALYKMVIQAAADMAVAEVIAAKADEAKAKAELERARTEARKAGGVVVDEILKPDCK